MIAATIIPDTMSVIQAARLAARQGCGLYITPDGRTVVAPQPLPGWQRIGVAIKRLRLWDERSDRAAAHEEAAA